MQNAGGPNLSQDTARTDLYQPYPALSVGFVSEMARSALDADARAVTIAPCPSCSTRTSRRSPLAAYTSSPEDTFALLSWV
ncbi:hypothetical protein UY3_08203 [Chelonia mydas]|uniref:Uncharacterized protein n=1 Tax=Chelonia mydas TaxID=8469 RepID=M7B9H6_CHEMY|nr:hypothetical protein UY3_08203 [Chelonia mydas]